MTWTVTNFTIQVIAGFVGGHDKFGALGEVLIGPGAFT
jgi:hypothetical protein